MAAKNNSGKTDDQHAPKASCKQAQVGLQSHEKHRSTHSLVVTVGIFILKSGCSFLRSSLPPLEGTQGGDDSNSISTSQCGSSECLACVWLRWNRLSTMHA